MQRWLSIFLGLAAFGLAVAVVVRTMSDRSLGAHDTHGDAAVVTDAGKLRDAGPVLVLPLFPEAGGLDAGVASDMPSSGAFGHFADGRPVPPLPDGSPKQIRLGVVLMTFAGAQGAPPNARSKKDALELATKLASDAKSDFHATVIRGDNGSTDDVGRIPRGVLEPAIEYTLFTMPVGSVSDALETPRGYWIAKRSE
jgi:hypothetical protein